MQCPTPAGTPPPSGTKNDNVRKHLRTGPPPLRNEKRLCQKIIATGPPREQKPTMSENIRISCRYVIKVSHSTLCNG